MTSAYNEGLMAATECWCNPMPHLGVCTVCLREEITTLEAQNKKLGDVVLEMALALKHDLDTFGRDELNETTLVNHADLINSLRKERVINE